MVRLVAKGALRYASQDIADGCEFEASDKDAFILRSVGKAVDSGYSRVVAGAASPNDIRRERGLEATALVAEMEESDFGEGVSLSPDIEPARKKRQYRRRDLQVEA